MTSDESHFLPAESLLKATKKKIDNDAIKSTQLFAEKVITDIINRSIMLAKHANKDVLDIAEISIVVEKDFDYTFGLRQIYEESKTPGPGHVDKIAEISRL